MRKVGAGDATSRDFSTAAVKLSEGTAAGAAGATAFTSAAGTAASTAAGTAACAAAVAAVGTVALKGNFIVSFQRRPEPSMYSIWLKNSFQFTLGIP